MKGFIYETTYTKTGQRYIGQTTKTGKDFEKYYGSGLLVQRIYKKYGDEFFIKRVLCECSSKNELNEKEIFYIDKYKPELNISYGGTGGNLGEKVNRILRENHADFSMEKHPSWGKKRSEETKKKMKDAWNNRERNHTEEWKKEHSKRMKGENNPMFGINVFAELPIEKRKEIKEKLKQRMLKNPTNSKEKPTNGKKIRCETTGEEYFSMRQAERNTGTGRRQIAKSIKTGTILKNGSTWTQI